MPKSAGRQSGRLRREKKTVLVMIRRYCRDHHGSPPRAFCPECRALRDYAFCRLDRCPFGSEKPTCAKCPIHCYKPAMRERIRAVMRYAGPRMAVRHPLLALLHLLDDRRQVVAQGKEPRQRVRE